MTLPWVASGNWICLRAGGYTYAGNDPLNFKDPTGYQWQIRLLVFALEPAALCEPVSRATTCITRFMRMGRRAPPGRKAPAGATGWAAQVMHGLRTPPSPLRTRERGSVNQGRGQMHQDNRVACV
jgi:hypothetical protein